MKSPPQLRTNARLAAAAVRQSRRSSAAAAIGTASAALVGFEKAATPMIAAPRHGPPAPRRNRLHQPPSAGGSGLTIR